MSRTVTCDFDNILDNLRSARNEVFQFLTVIGESDTQIRVQMLRAIANSVYCALDSAEDAKPAKSQSATLATADPKPGNCEVSEPSRKPSENLVAWATEREREMGRWLNEIALLTSELLADIDHHYDHQELEDQLLHLHSRIWAMRHTFGFDIEPTPKTEVPT